jgi:predicted dehydrogenase
MASRYRVAVVGAGIAERHVEAFARIPGLFEVPVLCSLDEERGRRLCADHGIAEYTRDIAAVIGSDDIDILDICTPPASHFELCERALAAGKHVICEKPLFGSLAECDRMAGILARTDRQLMPIFQYRYGAGLQKLKLLVERGLAGRPYMTTVETHWWRGPDYYAVPWRGKWTSELGGGLLGHAIHAHDMLNYIHGPCAEVFAFGETLVNPIEVEDTVALAVRMANGSLASLSMTLGSREEISRLRFCFADLTAESCHDRPYAPQCEPWRWLVRDEAARPRIEAALADFAPGPEGFAAQFAGFYTALEQGGAAPVSLADGRLAIELATAIYASAASGSDVALPIAPDHPLYRGWADAA